MSRKALFICMFAAFIQGCGTFLPSPPAPIASPAVPPPTFPPAVTSPHRPERSEALLQALMALGVDYKYGGKSAASGFDCSGLVAHVYREAWGISLPPTVRGQSQAGWPVKLLELQPGDLVFYDTLKRPYSHVGIYLGDGKFVHSPRTGAQVRVESIKAAYWAQRFNGARRIEPSL
jgi:cell wall-associated NlpC family hydrolase